MATGALQGQMLRHVVAMFRMRPRSFSRQRALTGGGVCEQQRNAETGDFAVIDFLHRTGLNFLEA
jgi:hypothetical protein